MSHPDKVEGCEATTSSTADKTSEAADNIYVVLYDYVAQHEDELNLVKQQRIKVLSKNYKISGDDGWWTGVNLSDNKRGIFPFNYVGSLSEATSQIVSHSISSSIRKINLKQQAKDKQELPPHIPYAQLEFKDCIGAGGFGKVYRGFWSKSEKKRSELGKRTFFFFSLFDFLI